MKTFFILLTASLVTTSSALVLRANSTTGSVKREKRTAVYSEVTKNPNGVEFGTPDLEITCPFHRAFNPRTTSYKEFRADIAKVGMPPLLTDVFAWPAIALQHGFFKALFFRKSLDTTQLSGILDGIQSHKDRMWSYREELNKVLEGRQSIDGTIGVDDLYLIKEMATKKENMEYMSHASYNEIALVFIICGGDVETGR